MDDAVNDDVFMLMVCCGIDLIGRGFDISDLRAILYGTLTKFLIVKVVSYLAGLGFSWWEGRTKKKFHGQPLGQMSGLQFVKGAPIEVNHEVHSKENPGIRRVLVLEAWATWCKPCEVTIPHLSEVAKKFSDREVYVVGVTDEARNKDKVLAFVERMGDRMAYTVAMDTDGSVRREVFARSGMMGIPHAVVVGVDGFAVWSGHPMDKGFEAAVTEAAAAASPRGVSDGAIPAAEVTPTVQEKKEH
ncbi:hypothetical protein HK405_007191 [Cladochytrium tenue]|nr:hypothetical protein HK405_007191 [Cladochytrium tenue]